TTAMIRSLRMGNRRLETLPMIHSRPLARWPADAVSSAMPRHRGGGSKAHRHVAKYAGRPLRTTPPASWPRRGTTGHKPPVNGGAMESQELRKAGLKVTHPRMRILQLLEQKSAQHHMTAEDIYRQLL